MYIEQSTWIFVVTVCSSVMCREIAVPCSMRTHYKECISNESCSWCCDPAVRGEGLEQREVCRCEETSVGERSVQAGYSGVDLCRPDNSSTVDCSGRGACVCGRCECELRENPNEEIFGTFCECDNFSCARWNGLLCGGAERGRCVCVMRSGVGQTAAVGSPVSHVSPLTQTHPNCALVGARVTAAGVPVNRGTLVPSAKQSSASSFSSEQTSLD